MRVCDFANNRVLYAPVLMPGKHTLGQNGAACPGSGFNSVPAAANSFWCIWECRKTFPDHYNAVTGDNVVLAQRLIAVLTT